jgi:hypothetical protein
VSKDTVRVTAVNHATIDIACEPQRVWRDILETFLEGGQFVQQGYQMEPLTEDPAAFLGGYRIHLKGADAAITDDRIVHVTERDEHALRLSLFADYRLPPEMALVVHASYQAVPIHSGTRYELHAYSNFNLARPERGATPTLADTVATFTKQAAVFLNQRLAATKVRLEAAS